MSTAKFGLTSQLLLWLKPKQYPIGIRLGPAGGTAGRNPKVAGAVRLTRALRTLEQSHGHWWPVVAALCWHIDLELQIISGVPCTLTLLQGIKSYVQVCDISQIIYSRSANSSFSALPILLSCAGFAHCLHCQCRIDARSAPELPLTHFRALFPCTRWFMRCHQVWWAQICRQRASRMMGTTACAVWQTLALLPPPPPQPPTTERCEGVKTTACTRFVHSINSRAHICSCCWTRIC